MKISLNWVREYVDLPADFDIDKIAYDLTMSTVEVEGHERMLDKFANIIVGRIEEVLPHPNADKLRICRTDIGGGEVKEIVCGGSNLEAGMKVAVALPGAWVRWHGEGEPVEIKAAKLRGVESYGMICASTEIGLFDLFPFEEPATIVDLSSFDAEPGTNLAVALGIDDVVLEIDNKSLTNRPDLWGHYGIARELAAIYSKPMKPIAPFDLPSSDGGLSVSIDDTDRCMRYVGALIENVEAKPASFKIRSRIWLVGMRPINALVDITNYVMLAVGQPTHAFDRDNIVGGITVRRAKQSERLDMLNGRSLELTPEDLVIADDKEAVALAGVMGGSKDSILPTTKRVILEIASFDALGTRRTAQRHDIRTEASSRYEKALDPQRVDQALAAAAALFKSEFPDAVIAGVKDVYPRPLEPATVTLSLAWLASRIGKKLTEETVAAMLSRLGFGVTINGDEMTVVAPSWRSTGDISLPDDIMEEVARLYGYENFEPAPITTMFTGAIKQPRTELSRKIREYLAFRCGMNEIFTYPWVKDELIDAAGIDRSEMLEISTPPAPDEKYVRSSLVPNILGAVAGNSRYLADFKLFELTQVFFDRDYSAPYSEREKLPRQRRHVGGAIVSSERKADSLFREAKGIVEMMPRYVHAEGFTFEQRERPTWADEIVWLNVISGQDVIGCIALVSKKSALACGIKQHAIMIFELDTDAISPLASRTNAYHHLPEHPQNEYDVSMLFDGSVKWKQIADTAVTERDLADPKWYVRKVDLIEEYRGRQIPEGKKSITIRMTIGSDTKTLTGDEIEKSAAAVVKRLTKQLGGEARS